MIATKKQANKVLALVKQQYGAHIYPGNGPVLTNERLFDHEWGHTKFVWKILWEGGPYEWAIMFGTGWNPYIEDNACTEYTAEAIYILKHGLLMDEGIFTECETSYCLGIYRNEG
jgi:hypothetical protein